MMPVITLEDAELNQLISILWNASGAGISCGITHPLVMKIAEQARQQTLRNGRYTTEDLERRKTENPKQNVS